MAWALAALYKLAATIPKRDIAYCHPWFKDIRTETLVLSTGQAESKGWYSARFSTFLIFQVKNDCYGEAERVCWSFILCQ